MPDDPKSSNTPPGNINTAQYWDDVYRREWESGAVTGESYNRDYGPIHDAMIDLIPDGTRTLDIACGTGLLCRKIKQRRPACRVLGVDFSAYTVARNLERDAKLGVEYRRVDIRTDLPTLGEPFDVITMCEILEHLDNPEKVLADAMGILKPGGLFILTCPHDREIDDPEHVRIWGHDELFHALASYSRMVSFTHFPPPWFNPWMMAHCRKNQ